MRALIVDDSRAIRVIVGGMMKELGYEVTDAANGRQALDRLAAMGTTPDVVLVDWNMPEMNGLEFVRAVRAIPAYFNLPIIMVTTETEMERIALALLAGVNEYVMKPFDLNIIQDKLQLLGIGS